MRTTRTRAFLVALLVTSLFVFVYSPRQSLSQQPELLIKCPKKDLKSCTAGKEPAAKCIDAVRPSTQFGSITKVEINGQVATDVGVTSDALPREWFELNPQSFQQFVVQDGQSEFRAIVTYQRVTKGACNLFGPLIDYRIVVIRDGIPVTQDVEVRLFIPIGFIPLPSVELQGQLNDLRYDVIDNERYAVITTTPQEISWTEFRKQSPSEWTNSWNSDVTWRTNSFRNNDGSHAFCGLPTANFPKENYAFIASSSALELTLRWNDRNEELQFQSGFFLDPSKGVKEQWSIFNRLSWEGFGVGTNTACGLQTQLANEAQSFSFNAATWRNGRLNLSIGGLSYNYREERVPLQVTIVIPSSAFSYLGLSVETVLQPGALSATVNGIELPVSVSSIRSGVRLVLSDIPINNVQTANTATRHSVRRSANIAPPESVSTSNVLVRLNKKSQVAKKPQIYETRIRKQIRPALSASVPVKSADCDYQVFLRSTTGVAVQVSHEVKSERKRVVLVARIPKVSTKGVQWLEGYGVCKNSKRRVAYVWGSAKQLQKRKSAGFEIRW